jgi:chemotaxis-related protein WspD
MPWQSRTRITDCWNRIGVRGDASCPELARHVHCRNCPVHADAAACLLDSEAPNGYLSGWTHQIAQNSELAEADAHSHLIFRVGAEWLALPTAVLNEVASLRPIHPLPHRRHGVVLGLANIRGELLVCFSLSKVLNIRTASGGGEGPGRAHPRLLVLAHEGHRAVCPVDEVSGTRNFSLRERGPVPSTVAQAAATYTQAVLSLPDKTVGLLDDALLFHTFQRSLA